MTKPQNIQSLFLSLVYLLLLFSVVVPHHHHEETACFTTTHCDDDFESPTKHVEGVEDHHHNHKAGEDAKHCISVKYYLLSHVNKNIKRVVDYPSPEHGHTHFLAACKPCCENKNETISSDFKFNFNPLDNTFIAFVKRELPLRGPPSYLA